MARNSGTLGDNTSSGAKASIPYPVGDGLVTVFAYGTFSATFSIEISPDGTNFVVAKDTNGTALSGLTAAGSWNIQAQAAAIRMNVTAFTSGTVSGRVVSAGG